MDSHSDTPMVLHILTPTGTAVECGCDSVNFVLQEDAQGRQGGSVGIRRGHAPSIFALAEGPVVAQLRGQEVYRGTARGGFASVEHNRVTIVTDNVPQVTEQ